MFSFDIFRVFSAVMIYLTQKWNGKLLRTLCLLLTWFIKPKKLQPGVIFMLLVPLPLLIFSLNRAGSSVRYSHRSVHLYVYERLFLSLHWQMFPIQLWQPPPALHSMSYTHTHTHTHTKEMLVCSRQDFCCNRCADTAGLNIVVPVTRWQWKIHYNW